MTIPLRNIIYDRIKEAGALTDAELYKGLIKNGDVIAEDRFNKVLLDLEIHRTHQGLLGHKGREKD